MTQTKQMRLPFHTATKYEAADFVETLTNRAAISWLRRNEWPDQRLAIWGPGGCGKTHLLHVWADTRGFSILDGITLTGLPDLPMAGGVAVDNADQVVDGEALLHLLNAARDRRLFVLLAARFAPAQWVVSLPDLSSRLRTISAAEIEAPDDELLEALVVREMGQRQLNIPTNLPRYLVRHCTRSAAGMLDAVRRLDEAALAHGKAITRSFAAEVLGMRRSTKG